jgi:hypothetical protein
MAEEQGTLTPDITLPSPSSPLHGMKVSPLDSDNHGRGSYGEERRVSSFFGDGLNAFLAIYGNGDGPRRAEASEVQFPPGPMDRYEYWDEDVPGQPSGHMGADVVGVSEGKGEG